MNQAGPSQVPGEDSQRGAIIFHGLSPRTGMPFVSIVAIRIVDRHQLFGRFRLPRKSQQPTQFTRLRLILGNLSQCDIRVC